MMTSTHCSQLLWWKHDMSKVVFKANKHDLTLVQRSAATFSWSINSLIDQLNKKKKKNEKKKPKTDLPTFLIIYYLWV